MNVDLLKRNISLLIFLFILMVLPLAIFLLGQRQEIRKKAGEFPPAVVFLQRNVTSPLNDDFTLTLLLQGAGLQSQKIDAADIIFKYPKDALELIPTANNKAVTLHTNFPSSLKVFNNDLRTTEPNENYVILTFRTELAGGKGTFFSPEKDPVTGIPKDIVIGSVKFKPLKRGIARVEFDPRTVVAAAGINTTNYKINEGDNRDTLVNVAEAQYAIQRLYPNKVLLGYSQPLPVTITGKGFISGQTVKIGNIDCAEPRVIENGSKITCVVQTGLALGNYIVTLNTAGNTLAMINDGFTVYNSNTPLLSFKLKFFGINNYANFDNQNLKDLGYPEMPLRIKIVGNGKERIFSNVLVTAAKVNTNDVIFETKNLNSDVDKIDQRLALFDSQVDSQVNFPAGTYDIYIKGPKQLQKKFTIQLNGGDNNIDKTLPQSVIMGGDLPLTNGQDGKVNSVDYQYIISHFDKQSETPDVYNEYLRVSDLNLDGGINAGDMSVIAQTLGENQDEDQ